MNGIKSVSDPSGLSGDMLMLRFLTCQFHEISNWFVPARRWEHIESNLNAIVLGARLANASQKIMILKIRGLEGRFMTVRFVDFWMYLAILKLRSWNRSCGMMPLSCANSCRIGL